MRESRLRGGFLPPRIHPPRGRQATRRASYGRGDLSPYPLRLVGESEAQPQQAQAENHLPSLYGSPGAAWQDKPVGRYQIAAAILVYLVCQICGCDTVSGMLDRGLKGAKAPSQVSKVSRQAITLGNLQSTDKTYEVCL